MDYTWATFTPFWFRSSSLYLIFPIYSFYHPYQSFIYIMIQYKLRKNKLTYLLTFQSFKLYSVLISLFKPPCTSPNIAVSLSLTTTHSFIYLLLLSYSFYILYCPLISELIHTAALMYQCYSALSQFTIYTVTINYSKRLCIICVDFLMIHFQ